MIYVTETILFPEYPHNVTISKSNNVKSFCGGGGG